MRVECQFDLHLFKEKKKEVENLKDDETLSTVLPKAAPKFWVLANKKAKKKKSC